MLHAQQSIGGFGRNSIGAHVVANDKLQFNEATEQSFLRAIRSFTDRNAHAAFVSIFDQCYYKHARCYLSSDSMSGYAITSTGMLVSLFSWSGLARGQLIVESAIANGANHLECFDGKLKALYESCGFIVDQRYPFNVELAPADWNYQRDGTPDYLEMVIV